MKVTKQVQRARDAVESRHVTAVSHTGSRTAGRRLPPERVSFVPHLDHHLRRDLPAMSIMANSDVNRGTFEHAIHGYISIFS